MEDCLIGTVDLEQSLETGATVFSPGLLAKAHRGILYVDEINLLEDEVADILIKVLSDGYVNVEREGLSVRYPCRPHMIATYNPEEGELRDHLLDRFAIALSADARPLSVQERVQGVDNVIGFSGGTQQQSSDEAEKRLQQAETEEQNLRTRVELARMRLQTINMSSAQIKYLCEVRKTTINYEFRIHRLAETLMIIDASLHSVPWLRDCLTIGSNPWWL